MLEARPSSVQPPARFIVFLLPLLRKLRSTVRAHPIHESQPTTNCHVEMIRRNPTLILMNDNDVQDIRVNKEQVDPSGDQNLAMKMKRMADNPNLTSEDFQMLESMRLWKEREEHEIKVKPCTRFHNSLSALIFIILPTAETPGSTMRFSS